MGMWMRNRWVFFKFFPTRNANRKLLEMDKVDILSNFDFLCSVIQQARMTMHVIKYLCFSISDLISNKVIVFDLIQNLYFDRLTHSFYFSSLITIIDADNTIIIVSYQIFSSAQSQSGNDQMRYVGFDNHLLLHVQPMIGMKMVVHYWMIQILIPIPVNTTRCSQTVIMDEEKRVMEGDKKWIKQS